MRALSLFICSIALLISIPAFTGCEKIKFAQIEEGQDAIVVNAERAQRSSLDVYEIVTNWEYNHRATLPPEVSRAVDAFRAEFPPAWKQSREALKEYKAKRGPTTNQIENITTALLIAQQRLLALKSDANPSQAAQAMNSLSSLVHSLRILFNRTSPATTNSVTR